VEDLSATERAQEEFFHLFEALSRRSAWIFLAADRPPSKIAKVEERLRSRFEGGLVVDLGKGAETAPATGKPAAGATGKGSATKVKASPPAKSDPPEEVSDRSEVASPVQSEAAVKKVDTPWFPARDKVVWTWPTPEERIAEGVDG
jgi:hypothetical protein